MTRLPSFSSRPIPEHARRVRPKTYSVAVYLVGAVIVLQVAMFISIFWLRAMVVPVNTLAPRAISNTQTTAQTVTPPPPHLATSDLPSLPSLASAPARPALLSVPNVTDKLSQIEALNDQALVLARKNQTQQAIEMLIKAEDMDPRNPSTLKNMAETYYLMNDSAQSKTYWQRLVDLGPGVGTVYALARDHVMLLNTSAVADAIKATSLLPRKVYIDAVQKTPVETVAGQAQFNVHAVLMRQSPPPANFDQKKLQPYVIFYQQMPDGTLLPDLSQRKGAFDDTFLFWNNKLKEPFGVDYVMPIPGSRGPNNTTMGEYYGFVIGVYYDKKLQDSRAEPADLLVREPLPLEIE